MTLKGIVFANVIIHTDKICQRRNICHLLNSEYRETGNFRVVQFSRNFAVSINPRKLKSAKYFPIFETISVEELVAYTVAICGSYLFTCGKTSNMQLSKNSL